MRNTNGWVLLGLTVAFLFSMYVGDVLGPEIRAQEARIYRTDAYELFVANVGAPALPNEYNAAPRDSDRMLISDESEMGDTAAFSGLRARHIHATYEETK